MPHLSRPDGVKLHYEVHGPVQGHGPALLLSHGYSATSAMWAGQVAPLSGRHRLILWDMRGHGASDSPDDPALYSAAATVGDMAAHGTGAPPGSARQVDAAFRPGRSAPK